MRKWFVVIVLLWASTSFAKQVKVACVGNSVTYGYMLEDRENDCYPAQLARMLGNAYVVGNFGKSGATLLRKGHRPYEEQQEFKDAIDFAPDIAIIHLGLNDTDPRDWPNYRDDFTADYLHLIDTFRQVNPEVRIWVCRMTPITFDHPRFLAGTRNWYDQIQNNIAHVAKVAHVGLIDLQEGLYSRPQLLPDALHPSPEGAKILAKTVYSAITGNYGGLKFSPLFTDNMVIQRDKEITFRGTADADAIVTFQVAGRKKRTTAGKDGKWQVTFEAMPAGGPYDMVISGCNQVITFHNVYVGEVWLCSGQSNMVFMVKQSAEKDETLNDRIDSRIHLFDMQPCAYTNQYAWDSLTLEQMNRMEHYIPTKWHTADTANVAKFSAVAYAFGKMLADSLNVHVGLICNAIGGAPVEAFIDRRTVEFNPQLVEILRGWPKNHLVQEWARDRAALNIQNSKVKNQRHSYTPCYLYETGIQSLAAYPLRGAIWYQGESNAHNVEWHEMAFPLMVQSWRNTWGEDFPFYFVQLSSLNRPSWPHFRDSQRRLMGGIKNTGMAVCSDHGDPGDVHPREKRVVGERLARWALNRDYGYKSVVPSGPLFKSVEFKKEAARVAFDYGTGMTTSDGEAIRTFELAGEDGLFYPAEAEVKNGVVEVRSGKVKNPKQVRYGWQPYTTANLVNGAGLPASTFHSRD